MTSKLHSYYMKMSYLSITLRVSYVDCMTESYITIT